MEKDPNILINRCLLYIIFPNTLKKTKQAAPKANEKPNDISCSRKII